jgi:hypothetical protein
LADAPGAAWSSDGQALARCVGRSIEVEIVAQRFPAGRHMGCAPAWRPGGELTFARGAAIYGHRPRCSGPGCERVIVSERALRAAASQHPNLRDAAGPLRVSVRELGWLTRSRVAVHLVARPARGLVPEAVLAVFEGARLVGAHVFFRDRSALVEASPDGRLIALDPAEVLRANGVELPLPTALNLARAFAWSPDGRFLAAATRASIFVVNARDLERVPSTRVEARVYRLPIAARDLAWIGAG